MKKSLKILLSIVSVFVLVSMVGHILIDMRVIPGGNWNFLIVAMLGVAYVLLMIALAIRRNQK